MPDLKKLSTILSNAPAGATHYCGRGFYWLLSKTSDETGSSFLFYSKVENQWLRERLTDENLRALSDLKTQISLLERIESLDKAVSEEIENRDNWEERASKLAYAVGAHFGETVGEHSSANCPIQNAHELLSMRN